MQSLLRWSIENSTPLDGAPSDRPPVSNQKLDPGIIDMILGRPDAEQMKEDVTVAVDATKSEDDRLAALDHLEMLVEHIDNANDLRKLKLWEPLLSLLDSAEASTEIKVQVLWVIGTAIQNNPEAQDVYLACNPLPTLLGFLTPSPALTLGARAKALYTLSGLLKHNAPAVKALDRPEISGWNKLREALQDPEISVRRKTVFLLNSLILPSTPTSTSQQHNPPLLIGSQETSIATTPTTTSVTSTTLHTVDEPNANNPDPIHANSHSAHLADPSRSDTSKVTLEAFGRLLYTYAVSCRGSFTGKEKGALRQWIEKEKTESGGISGLAERLNLSQAELSALVRRLD
ncbi:hypothetical protein NP233_g2830 [Leucocoprinus birnbaumii]|uniref:Nucleotide exchange factor Fes1 domain-containing protein n=1 Tax=Leucocoprinus birnbaumii TaxID=56174 RepID=A0AAD5W1H3_9AGAR|nr:hypothetical protein NP233_g2830 [Leucocoprinus birnbaumii]